MQEHPENRGARRAGTPEGIKTMEGWRASPASGITGYLHIGDRVDAGIAAHFRHGAPGAGSGGLIQAKEAYSRLPHPLTGSIQDTYLTFTEITAGGRTGWVYCGDCFKGDIIPHAGAVAAAHPGNRALAVHASAYRESLAKANGDTPPAPARPAPSPAKDSQAAARSAASRPGAARKAPSLKTAR